MDNINKTLYIPLYGKAFVSRKGLFLKDKKAEEIWAKQQFPLKGKSKSKWLAYYMGIRAAVFDNWLRQKMQEFPDAVILHIGCGMDSRVLRVGTQTHLWYDVDFENVIKERAAYYTQTDDYQMLAGDVRNAEFLRNIPQQKNAVVVMEGVSMYLTNGELQAFINALSERFLHVALLLDCYTPLAAKLSKRGNPVKDVGVQLVYGVDKPSLLNSGRVTFLQELDMSPKIFINELHGIEKFIFKTLYAGNLSKKLYKLFEYETI
ncbi:MAG: class I SAM-dependent methyltransferase [Clostridia bacterium]|nr:class I SAM-dependent methyltransferase [Clostridia bacterium]